MPPVAAGADDPLLVAIVDCGLCDAGRELSAGVRCDAGVDVGREFDARVDEAGRLVICGSRSRSRRGAGAGVAAGAGAAAGAGCAAGEITPSDSVTAPGFPATGAAAVACVP